MILIAALLTASVLGLIGLGLYLEFRPLDPALDPARAARGLRVGLLGQLVLFVVGLLGILTLGYQDAFADTAMAATGGGHDATLGFGLAILGAGLPTALATLAAGFAVGPVGAAALAVIAERPEAFGRSLVYLGLAEGIAIYGLVVSILLIGKLA